MYRNIVLLLLAALLAFAYFPTAIKCEESTEANNVGGEKEFAISLDADSFDKLISTKNVFVKFFAPWCGHCKRLHPLWEQLAELMNVAEDAKLNIAKVDCTQHQALCHKHDITGYPTLRLFKLGEANSVKFKGTRDMPSITEFINQELNSIADVDTSENTIEFADDATAGRVVNLDESSFAKHVSSGNHFVKFYAPWCSHCQRLAPTWDTLAKKLQNGRASISKIDCTLYRPLCQDFDVKGYPTLLWIEDGKKIEKYSGGRDLETLEAYVRKMLGASAVGKDNENDNTDDDETKPSSAEEAAAAKEADTKSQEDLLKVVQITGNDFAKTVAQGVTFVKFYAPWCGHCQKLSPTWDDLAAKLHGSNSGIVVAKVDCTEPENKQICADQEIEGYPTLFAYKNGERQSEYDGTRTLAELQHYINKFIGHDEL